MCNRQLGGAGSGPAFFFYHNRNTGQADAVSGFTQRSKQGYLSKSIHIDF